MVTSMARLKAFRQILFLLSSLIIILATQISCGKKAPATGSEYQRWADTNRAIAGIFDVSAESFYGANMRMPVSLDDMDRSGWLWFYPVAPDYAHDFEIVDRPLDEWEDDKEKVHFSLSDSGYDYYYFIRKSEETTEHQQESIGSSNAESRYDQHRSFDPDAERYNLHNPGYLRQLLAFNLSRQLMRRYYTEFNSLPSRAEELYNAWFEPRPEALAGLQRIPEGNAYSVYVGFKNEPDRGIMYFEVVRPDRSVFIHQRVFKIDTMGNAWTVIETLLPEDDNIEKEDSIMFIDSTLPNWGIE